MNPVDAQGHGTQGHATLPRLGLRANAAQFTILVAINALVGGMVGQQQTVLPLLAEREFGLTGYTFIFTYVIAFGVTKAAANYFAGTWSDRYGRKPVLIAGWLVAIPVPLMLIWAPNWGWVVAANVLLGINQGLTWSTTVIMKIDLVGPQQRGLAMGLNEAAGYGAVALTSLAAGYLAAHYGLRPAPFLLGLSYTASRSGSRPLPSRRPGTTPAPKPSGMCREPTVYTTTFTVSSATVRSLCRPASARRRCPRPARRDWSTTSTSDSLGACSRSCSQRRDFLWVRSGCCSRSTRPCGASVNCSPAHSRTGGAASA